MKARRLVGSVLLSLILWGGAEAQPANRVAGFPIAISDSTANDLPAEVDLTLSVPNQSVKGIAHRDSKGKLNTCILEGPFTVSVKDYTFTFKKAVYEAKTDTFVGDARITGLHLPKRIFAKKARFNERGLLSVEQVSSLGWGTLHTPWNIDQGKLTPDGLAWANNEIEAKGLFLQGRFHAQVAMQLQNGRPVAMKLLKPTQVLHQRRVAFIKELRLTNGRIRVDGYTGDPAGKRWPFKNVGLQKSGELEIEFPLSWIPPEPPEMPPSAIKPAPMVQASSRVAPLAPRTRPSATQVASLQPMPALPSMPAIAPALPSTPTASPSLPAVPGLPTMPEMKQLSPAERDKMFKVSGIENALAKGLEVVAVDGAPNLQMVITQTSQGGTSVDGFIPLMDWAGQANVYGATRNGDKVVIDKSKMLWQRKNVRVPASGFGVTALQDPIYLDRQTGRLNSSCLGNPNVSGCIGQLMSWQVDTKEFRFACSAFSAASAKLNPVSLSAPFALSLNIPGQGVGVAGNPPLPPNTAFPNLNQDVNVSYQGGAEFDLVFLQDGHWGFEIRTALPQLDVGGPSWFRTGTSLAPKKVVFPTLFMKIYTNATVYFNCVMQGISVPIGDTGLALTSPGLLFYYLDLQKLFFLVLQAQVTIVDVDPNIFACQGKLFIDGSGMGKSGGGKAHIAGYLLNLEVADFDVAFSVAGEEETFEVTCPIFNILGFALEVSGEVKVHAPKDDWCVGVSGFLHIPLLGDFLGVTFYGYTDPFRLKFSFGGHDFSVDGGGNVSSNYFGPFDVLGVHWFGNETLDTTKGVVTAQGYSTWSGASSDSSAFNAAAALGNTTLSEEGCTTGNISLSNITMTLHPGGAPMPFNITSLPLQLDSSNNDFKGSTTLDVTEGKFSGKVECDFTIDSTGNLKVSLELPAAQGGPYTQLFSLTTQGVNKGGN